jgi:hypothetical protein
VNATKLATIGDSYLRACLNFLMMQMCFASGSAEKKAVFEELVDETI